MKRFCCSLLGLALGLIAVAALGVPPAAAQSMMTPAQLLQRFVPCNQRTPPQPPLCTHLTDMQDVIASLTPETGSGAPTASAYFVGQKYRDTTNGVSYEAVTVGNGAADWQITANAASTGILGAASQAASFLVQTALGTYEWAFGVVELPSIAALRANTIPWPAIHVQGWSGPGTPGGGDFEYVASDTSSADNSGTIIVDAKTPTGHRYYRRGVSSLYEAAWFGAVCNGSTSDDTALHAAETAAENAGYASIVLPSNGICEPTSQLVVEVPWLAFGQGTLQWKSDLGANTAGVVVTDGGSSSNEDAWRDIALIGPGCSALGSCSFSVGVAPAQMDGLQIGQGGNGPQTHLTNLNIQGFKHALVYDQTVGHVLIDGHNILTNDWEGIYLLATGGDFKFYGGEVTGLTMAALAMANGGQGLSGGCLIQATHLGFTPYAILVEPGTGTGGFADSCSLEEVHAESIGNAAVKNEAAPYNVLTAFRWKHVGFSWDASGFNGSSWTYTLGGGATPPTKTVTCTPSSGSNVMPCSGNPVTAGFAFTQHITGTDIPANTYVVSVTSSSITMSQNATGSPGAETVSGFYERIPLDLGAGDLEGTLEIWMGTFPFLPGISGQVVHMGYCGANTGAGRVLLHYDGPVSVYTSQVSGTIGLTSVVPSSATAPSLMTIDNDDGNCMANSRIDMPSASAAPPSVTLQGAYVDPSYSSVASSTSADSFSTTTQTSGLHYLAIRAANLGGTNSQQLLALVPSGTSNTAAACGLTNTFCLEMNGNVFVNGSYSTTISGLNSNGQYAELAVDQTHNKAWVRVLDGNGNVLGNGWDNNSSDNPATNQGGFTIASGQTYKAGLVVNGSAANGAFIFALQGPFGAGVLTGTPSAFSYWGGTLNPSDTAAAITLPAGSTTASATVQLDDYAFSASGIVPECFATNNPSAPWWQPAVTAANSNQASIPIAMAAPPANDAVFSCPIRRASP